MTSSFTSSYQFYCQRFDALLKECMTDITPSLLKEAMQYSLLAGGKRIRPCLIYATGKLFDFPIEKLDSAALAIEMIHTYSLIHDDLPAMDNDDLRRGIPTCHVKYDEATAILAGDALQSYAFSILANDLNLADRNKIMMIKSLADASGILGMCFGQSLDLQSENQSISLDHMNKIHQNKTGALIKSAIQLAVFAIGDKAMPYLPYLHDYADKIGLAFQIQDDVLDVIGDKSIMGKNNGSDEESHKNTYTALIGLDESIEICHSIHQQALEALDKIPYNSELLRALADFIISRNK